MQQSSNHKHSPWGLAQLARHWVEGGEVSRFNSQQVEEEKEKDVTYQEKKQFQAWVQFHWYVYKQTSHAWQKLDSWINKNRISVFFIFFFFWFNIRIEPEVHPGLNAFATMVVQLQKINIFEMGETKIYLWKQYHTNRSKASRTKISPELQTDRSIFKVHRLW